MTFARAHVGWSSFLFLAVVMAAFTLFEVRQVPMDPGQRFWIVAASVAVAAFCGWVISLAIPGVDSVEGGRTRPR